MMTEAFVKKGSDFSDRPYLYSTARLSDGNKSIVFGPYGDIWKYQRRLGGHALRQYLTGTQLERRVHEAMQPVIDAMSLEKGAFNPHRLLNLTVFNIIHGLCFGKPMLFDDPEFHRMVDVFDRFAEVANGFVEDFIPILRLWPTQTFTMALKLADEFIDFTNKNYQRCKANFQSDKPNSLSDQLIMAQQTLKDEDPHLAAQITERHIAQIVNDVFGAGVDTSRTTLDWFFQMMVQFPEVQKRIHNELDMVVGSEIPGKEHRSKLIYLEAALMETMRLHYVIPVNIPHETLRDTTVGGYEIPAKTIVLVNSYEIMHDAKGWDEPWAFKPERFLDESQTKIVARHRSWIPFSMGHRSCLGESLAKLELVYIIGGLLQVFTFTLAPNTKIEYSGPQGIFNVPKPFKVILTRRDIK